MSDKVILITGASRGIGAATAMLAAAKGYAVCVNYCTNKAAADDVVSEIHKAGRWDVAQQGSSVDFLSGTGSSPLGPHGLHRRMRFVANHPPLKNP